MRPQARTPTTGCCTRREIGPVGVEDEASQCAMEAADGIKEEGTEVMPAAILDPPEIEGIEVTRTNTGNLPQNAGTVAREATRKVSAGKNAPIRINPDRAKPNTGIDSGRTTPKALKEPEMDRAPA